MNGLELPLAALALLGHAALWMALICRLHATGWPCQLLKAIDWVWLTLVVALPAWAGWTWLAAEWRFVPLAIEAADAPSLLAESARLYAWLCVAASGPALLVWLRDRWSASPAALESNHTEQVDLTAMLEQPVSTHWLASWLLRLPLNESLRIDVNIKTLRLPGLPPALDGLSIVHLSDLHLTGKLAPHFYREVVRLANALEGDLVAITGDIVESPECFTWLPETLGQLQARHGVHFILGNHDRRLPDVGELRRRLGELGWHDLGGGWRKVAIGAGELLLAGNELPWFAPAADFHDAPPALTVDPQAGLLRVLLAHSPDQLAWAQERGCDLVLAGHMHGGQVVLPLVGPLIGPSWHGTRYAGGVFDERPTLMHVSRGVAALHPFRFGASPEVTRLVLRSA